MTYEPAKKKRRWLGPVIILTVLVILIVAAFLVAEKLARDGAESAISGPIKQVLGSDQDVDVRFGPGSIILQALSGSVDQITITAHNVALGGATGDIVLTAAGVPLSTSGTVDQLGATLMIDEASVQALAPALGGTPAFVNDQLVISSQADILGQSVPVTVTVVPAAAEGKLAFNAVAMTVNAEDVSVDEVRAGAYGPGPAALLAAQSVCVAQFLPAALSLDEASIDGSHLVLSFSASSVALGGGGFTSKGTCA